MNPVDISSFYLPIQIQPTSSVMGRGEYEGQGSKADGEVWEVRRQKKVGR
jgi:allantoicase